MNYFSVRSMVMICLISLSGFAMSAEFELTKDVSYLGAERAEKMDVYLPPAGQFPRPLPVVIWIHGGGWVSGSKSAAREKNICGTLAENGYAAFSIDYVLGKGEGGKVPWPQNLDDCKSALKYIREHAAEYGIDPSRVAIAGGSAGAHLALMTGLTLESNRVSCIMDFYGPTWFTDEKRIARFPGNNVDEMTANAKAASPIDFIKKDSPPILVLHGTNDKTCDISYSRELVKKMESLGTVHEYIEVPGAPHSFHLQPKEMDLRPPVLAFLAKHLAKAK